VSIYLDYLARKDPSFSKSYKFEDFSEISKLEELLQSKGSTELAIPSNFKHI
jgi:hypothetical protein